MDRPSRPGVFICAFLLCILFVYTAPPPPKAKPAVPAASPAPVTAPAAAPKPAVPGSAPVNPPPAPVPETLAYLENPALKVTLTSRGAAIKEVELKLQKEDDGYVVLNKQAHSSVLELSGWPGADTAGFQAAQSSPDRIVYTTQLPGGVKWERSYAFVQNQENQAGMSGYLRV